jgi:hypothetical protein
MLHKNLLFIAALALVSASTPDARAQSVCFQSDSGGGVKIAKGAVPPPKGVCIPLAIAEEGPQSRMGAATGTMCRGSSGDGTSLVLQYTYTACTPPGAYFESATCSINIDAQGGLQQSPADQNGSCNGVFAVLFSANTNNPTAPLTAFTDTQLRVWICPQPPTTISERPKGTCHAAVPHMP